jgi:hypothetical protein
MPAYKKGFFIIKNSEGSVTLQGLAALVNDAMNAGFSDTTEITEHRDAGNVTRTLTKDFNTFQMTVRLTPGVGSAFADQAAVKAAIATIRKGDTFVTSGFEDADLNWASGDKAIVWEIGKTLSVGESMSVDVTARKFTDTAAAAIDFTAAWATL